MLDRLSVARKMTVIIAVAILIGLVIGAGGFVSYRAVLFRANEMYEDRMVPLADIGEAIQHAQEVRENVLFYVLEQSVENKFAVYEPRIVENSAALEEILIAYAQGNRTSEELVLLDEVWRHWTNYKATYTDILELDLAGGREEALEAVRVGASNDAFYNTLGALNDLRVINVELAAAARDAVVRQGQKGGSANTSILIGGIVVLALIGTAISRKITRPLIHLNNTMQSFEGDFTTQIAVTSQDEIGQLTEGFNRFMVILRKMITEVTELKRRFELILQSAGEGIYGVDAEFKTTFVNNAGAAMLGVEPEEIIGRPICDFVRSTKPEADSFWNLPAPFSAERVQRRGEDTLLRLDGTSFPVEYVSTPIFEGDKFAGTVVVFKDISKRKRAERVQARLRAIIEESPDFVTMANADGQVRYYNRAARKMLGLDGEADVSQHSLAEIHPRWAYDLVVKEALQQAAKDGMWTGESAVLAVDGQETPVLQTIVAHKNDLGEVNYFSSIATDISLRKRYEAELAFMANHDLLTGLYNRRGFEQELEKHVDLDGGALGRSAWTLLYLDMDNLKYVNDNFGHKMGDNVLKQFASLLKANFSKTDIIGRLGGDEFGVVLLDTDGDEARELAEEFLIQAHQVLTTSKDCAINSTASIGIVTYPQDGETIEELMIKADLAMYDAKRSGGSRATIYSPDLKVEQQVASRLQWTQRLREALHRERLRLFWQPIHSLEKDQVAMYELLLRMEGPDGGLVSPNVFMPIAARSGLLSEIDLWVVRQALQLLQGCRNPDNPLVLTLNLSGQAFTNDKFIAALQEELAQADVNPSRLILEITEQMSVGNLVQARKNILQLQALGVRLAIDDFGTGFACFDLLQRLPVEFVKIDGSFVQNLSDSLVNQHIVKVMVEVLQEMNKKIVAEFVEDEASLQILRQYGVEFGQGYYFGRPVPIDPGQVNKAAAAPGSF